MSEWEKFFAYIAGLFAVILLYYIATKLDEIADLLRKQRNSK